MRPSILYLWNGKVYSRYFARTVSTSKGIKWGLTGIDLTTTNTGQEGMHLLLLHLNTGRSSLERETETDHLNGYNIMGYSIFLFFLFIFIETSSSSSFFFSSFSFQYPCICLWCPCRIHIAKRNWRKRRKMMTMMMIVVDDPSCCYLPVGYSDDDDDVLLEKYSFWTLYKMLMISRLSKTPSLLLLFQD